MNNNDIENNKSESTAECTDCGWKGIPSELGKTILGNDILPCCPKCGALPWYDDIRNK